MQPYRNKVRKTKLKEIVIMHQLRACFIILLLGSFLLSSTGYSQISSGDVDRLIDEEMDK